MAVSLKPAEHYQYVMNLFQYYIYDMSEYLEWPPGEDGTYFVDDSVSGLSDYWSKPEHYPYLIMVDGEVAGFSLVRKYPDGSGSYDMGQFFIVRKFKRKGIGEIAFRLCVGCHPGQWLIRVLPSNLGAMNFWRKAIGGVAVDKVIVSNEPYKNTEMVFMRYSASVI